MLTKHVIKQLYKLQDVRGLDMDAKLEKNFPKMKSLIYSRASEHEQEEIFKLFNDPDYTGDMNDIIDETQELYMQAEDVYLRYNANPTIKSMKYDTKKNAKLRYYFFVGNKTGSLREQHNNGIVAHDFHYYMGGGYAQASEDDDYIKLIKQGKAMETPNPADLINDSDKIMDNIKLGKETVKAQAKKTAQA